MGADLRRWLRSPGDDEQQPPQVWLASVCGGPAQGVAGGGVYLGDGRVLTCAHVVNDALGRAAFEAEPPSTKVVRLAFPAVGRGGGDTFSAKLTRWVPARQPGPGFRPARDGDRTWTGDLALLELTEPPPVGLRPVRWVDMARDQDVRTWYGSGAAFTFADGSVEYIEDACALVDSDLRGAPIGPGYSGSPLWCEAEQAAVGIVLGTMVPATDEFRADQVARRTIVLPWQAIAAELDGESASGATTAGRGAGTASGFPIAPADRHAITAVLAESLADPQVRAAQAHRLADELRLLVDAQTVPSVDELADVVCTRPRALAVLVEGLAKAEPERTAKLLALGRASLIPWMLSVREHRWLHDLLQDDAARYLKEATAAALPHSTVFDQEQDHERAEPGADGGVRRLICALEEFWGDSAPVPEGTPRVPALLRAVEYVAACCPADVRRGLREWCESVAQRLGVARAALLERRGDAEAWADRRRRAESGAQPRLTVRLRRGTAGGFLCHAWYGPSHSDAADRTVLADERERGPAELARALHRILLRETAAVPRTAPAPALPPVIEVLLDPGDLDEPVEEWDGEDPDDGIPAVLGVEYAVVIRCPALRRRTPERLRSWRARWEQLDRGGLLRLDHRHTTPRQVYGLLKEDPAVARVVLRCAAEHRMQLRAVCLALGVPVVLWDRRTGDEGDGDQLTALMLNGQVRALPERIRRHRARVLSEEDVSTLAPAAPARATPALIWDDATRAAPLVQWSDPTSEETGP